MYMGTKAEPVTVGERAGFRITVRHYDETYDETEGW